MQFRDLWRHLGTIQRQEEQPIRAHVGKKQYNNFSNRTRPIAFKLAAKAAAEASAEGSAEAVAQAVAEAEAAQKK